MMPLRFSLQELTKSSRVAPPVLAHTAYIYHGYKLSLPPISAILKRCIHTPFYWEISALYGSSMHVNTEHCSSFKSESKV
uniref:Uncharacterized protein n=1 Tax=Timema monikensis TaxID=170555 RepID=A0A7R9ED97_9NEOP|nr:unnamed protein product [Timema monikensis]